MCPRLPVLEGGEFELQHLEGLDVIARFKVLKVLLLQKQKSHFSLTGWVLQVGGKLLQDVHSSRPVSLHDAVSEGGGSGLVQPAPRLLHQHIRARPQPDVTQVLSDEPHHLLVKLVQLRLAFDFSEELWVDPGVGRAEFSLGFTESVSCQSHRVHPCVERTGACNYQPPIIRQDINGIIQCNTVYTRCIIHC